MSMTAFQLSAEKMEREWAEQNVLAVSRLELAAGERHDLNVLLAGSHGWAKQSAYPGEFFDYDNYCPGIDVWVELAVRSALGKQLLAVRLFPATFKQPQTAFTFTVLKQFHIQSLASKKSAYEYVEALCKLTDNACGDRYRESLFAHRLWRSLALQRRTGQAHGFDKFVPHRRPGSLTLRCPACPEVGFNISAETMKAALETERHKFTLFVSLDGNFKLQRKNSYFVDDEDYKAYLKVVKGNEMVEYGQSNSRTNTFKNSIVI
ncbi:hypothetical protein DFH09DRAFT_1501297 [Mycena vulgaris]|nr:hypothetical protein DFH09DRAFT_1501297 [Mycena vulgaris]